MAKTKALICGFVFFYADCWFSHAVAHLHVGMYAELTFGYGDIVTTDWCIMLFPHFVFHKKDFGLYHFRVFAFNFPFQIYIHLF